MPHLPEALWWWFSCSHSCTSRLSSFYISYSRGHIGLTFVFSMMLYGHSQPPKSIYQKHGCLMPQWGNIFYRRSLKSCLTLCNPMEYSPSTSSVHGVLQAGILKWVAIPFSKGSSRPRDWTWVSHIAGRFFTIWATREAPTYSKWGIFLNMDILIHENRVWCWTWSSV